MKIEITIDKLCYISFGKWFIMNDCICVCPDELNSEEIFYFPSSGLSENLHSAYVKFSKRMKLKENFP